MKVKSICWCLQRNKVRNIPDAKNANGKVIQLSGNRRLQFSAVISVSVMSMGSGAFEMWISPALPYLKGENFKFEVTSDQVSWIVSRYNVGEIIGFLVNPLLINRISQIYTLLASALPQILASALLFSAENVSTFYVARISGGIGYGANAIVQNFYVNEIAEKNIRGLLASISDLGFLMGTISILITGTFLSYDNMNLTIFFFSLIFISIFVFMPESPYFYLKCNRDGEAVRCLMKLRGIED